MEAYSDGGGKVQALPDVLRGSAPVAKFLFGVFNQLRQKNVAISTLWRRFNGTLGVLLFEDNQLSTAITVEVHQGRIQRIYAVRNPDKLSSSGFPSRIAQGVLEKLQNKGVGDK